MVTLPPALAADRLQDWTAGEAGIYTHTREGAVRVGRVAADGMLQFEWPEGPSSRQTLAATFPTCREDGVAMAEPGDVAFLPTSLIVARGEGVDEELGALHLATSKEVVAWRTSFGQDSAAEGACCNTCTSRLWRKSKPNAARTLTPARAMTVTSR